MAFLAPPQASAISICGLVSKRTLLFLCVGFVALGVLTVYLWWGADWLAQRDAKQPVSFNEIPKVDIVEISIGQGSQGQTLLKQADGWSVEGYKASLKTVDEFLEAVAQSRAGALVSKNPNKHSSFGLDAISAKQIELKSTKQTQALWIGKEGPTYPSFYVKNPQSAQVYLADGRVRDFIDYDVEAWRDKTLADLKTDDIWAVSVIRHQNSLQYERGVSNNWTLLKKGVSKALSAADVQSLLALFTPLEAGAFANEAEQTLFAQARQKTEIKVFDAKKNILLDLEILEQDARHLAKSKNNDTLYVLFKYDFEAVLGVE